MLLWVCVVLFKFWLLSSFLVISYWHGWVAIFPDRVLLCYGHLLVILSLFFAYVFLSLECLYAISSLIYVDKVLSDCHVYSDKDITQCWLLCPFFYIFHFSCFLPNNISMIDLYATVVQMKGLSSFNTRFIRSFSSKGNSCTRSGISHFFLFVCCVWTSFFAIWKRSFWNEFLLEFSIFVIYVFHRDKT